MIRTLSALLLLTTGCGIDQEKFIEKYAAQLCDNIDACGKISETHGTYDECIQFYEIVADEQMIGDGCTIISDKAKACLKELRGAEGECPVAEDQSPSCGNVGDCAGGGSSIDTGL